jgi:NADH-quinone oxidoreductase subunit D
MPARPTAPRSQNARVKARAAQPQPPQQEPSTDDPRVMLDRQLGTLYEPIPPYPTRTEREGEFYSLGDGEMFLNLGPHHPATHGVLRLVLKLSGEQVVDVDPVLGYLHRGVEKICENSDYYHVIDQVDPLEYVSSLFQEWPAVLAFEKLMDVQVPRRAEYIRVLSGELLRVASHTLFMGFQALDLGGLTPILYGFIERDEIVEMLAALTGARMLFNYFRIGGVNGDLNHEFMSRLGDWMSRAAKQSEAQSALLNENEIFVRRMRGVGVLDRATALRYGVSGPNLRAAGVPFDVRRAHPYSIYPELDFNVPTRDEGDALARYLLRVDEIRESIKIIDQCLNNMPDGPITAKLPRLLRPRPGRAWAAVEGPRGMQGVYAMSDGTNQPYRFRIHDPSFVSLQTVPAILPGGLLADTMAIVASLDPVMGGIDKRERSRFARSWLIPASSGAAGLWSSGWP